MTSRTVTVSTAAQLTAAARAARGGDTILLAPGNFGDVRLDNLRPTGTITIKSADAANDAVMRTLTMMNSHNIIIEDIDISRPLAAGASQNSYAVNVGRAHNITFVGIDVSGSMNNDARDDGLGMSLNGSRLSIIDSTFTQLRTALAVAGSDFMFVGNTVTQVREGLSIRSMTRGLFSNNLMTDWQADYAKGEHPDMFQVHNGGTAVASSDLIFRNNIMLPGENGGVGGIFMRSATGKTDRHSNILIENNYYEGNFRHGISVSDTDDVTIRNNTVRGGTNTGPNSSLGPAILLSNVIGGLIENNITPLLLQSRTMPNIDITFANNIDLWDSKQKLGISDADLFPDENAGEIDFSHLNVVSTSQAAAMGIGFRAVAEIGDLAGSAVASMAAWQPGFDAHFTAFG